MAPVKREPISQPSSPEPITKQQRIDHDATSPSSESDDMMVDERDESIEPGHDIEPTTTVTPTRRVRNRKQATPRMQTPRTPTDRASALKWAFESLPRGVRCIESNVSTSSAVLAGYLSMEDTTELEEFLSEPTVKDTIETFMALKAVKFNVKGAKFQEKTKFSYKSLFEEITKDSMIMAELSTITSMAMTDPAFDVFPDRTQPSFFRGCHAALLFLLVKDNPKVFRQVGVSDTANTYFGAHIEDLWRALSIYTYYKDTISKGKKVAQSMATKVRFRTDDEMAARPNLSAGRGRHIWDEMDQMRNNLNIEEWPTDPIRTNATPEDAWIDNLRFATPKSTAKSDTLYRPKLSGYSARDVMKRVSERVHILHDDFTHEAVQIEDFISKYSTFDSEFNDDDATRLDAREICISATPMSFNDACMVLNISSNPMHEGLPPFETRLQTKFVPTAPQITGAVFMQKQEESPIGGGIIADDHGHGKTLQTLLHIALRKEAAQAAKAAGQTPDCRPTLILCPVDSIESWYNEWRQWFSKTLTFRQFFKSPLGYISDRATMVLPANKDLAINLIQSFPMDDPHTAGVVVVTSYETWAQRALTITPKAAKSEEDSNMIEETAIKSQLNAEHIRPDDDSILVDWEVTAHEERDLRIDDTNFTYSTPFKNVFRRVILDEGHLIKNTRTLSHRAVTLVKAQCIWVLSATPMMNVRDVLGYLVLFWRRRWAIEHVGGYAVHYSNSEFDFTPVANDLKTKDDYKAEFGTQRLWVLDPRLYVNTVDTAKNTLGDRTRIMLPAILQLLQLRRTMGTRFTALGKESSLEALIPVYHIAFVELAYNKADQRQHDTIWTEYRDALGVLSTSGDDPSSTVPPFHEMAAYRHVCLSTFDLKMDIFLNQLRQLREASEIQAFVEKGPEQCATVYQLFSQTDISAPIYTDRDSMVQYITNHSPKLQYLLGLILEGLYSSDAELRGKTIVMTQWPLENMVVSVLMDLLSIPHLVSRPGLSPSERARNHTAFNDPKDPHQVLVLSAANGVMDINFQEEYHRLVILACPDDVRTIIQMVGCIHHRKQKHERYVWILNINHSYDQIMQANALRNMALQLHDDLDMKEPTEDEIQKLCLAKHGHSFDHVSQAERNIMTEEVIRQYYSDFVDQYMNSLLGIRSPRQHWNNTDLYAKDEDDKLYEPRIRNRPSLNALPTKD